MFAQVIGSAAGGGYPQWNCKCAGCEAVRAGRPGFLPRTQDSVAIRADRGERFVLLNASPDIHAQIKATPALWPRAARDTPIGAVVLTNGDLDHVLGLFSLRESQPLAVYATESVWSGLSASVFIRTLKRFDGQLVERTLVLGEEVELRDAAGMSLGLHARAFSLPGKPPVHLVGLAPPSAADNVGITLRETSDERAPTFCYAAAFAALVPELSGHATVLLDGTFFSEDELVAGGLSKSRAKDMAHLPVRESLAALASAPGRKIYTHINNTNPMLDPESEQRGAVLDAGFEIAFDGMEIST